MFKLLKQKKYKKIYINFILCMMLLLLSACGREKPDGVTSDIANDKATESVADSGEDDNSTEDNYLSVDTVDGTSENTDKYKIDNNNETTGGKNNSEEADSGESTKTDKDNKTDSANADKDEIADSKENINSDSSKTDKSKINNKSDKDKINSSKKDTSSDKSNENNPGNRINNSSANNDSSNVSSNSSPASQNASSNNSQIENSNPAPVEPEDAVVDKKTTLTCSLSIDCKTILNNMDKLEKSKKGLVPKDGMLYENKTVTFNKGESVFDVLLRVCKEEKIHMEYEFTPLYNSSYVEGIGNLYEFDCGELSGWIYEVNDWIPNYGMSRYQLNDKDIIRIRYTCDLGKDVGFEMKE